MIKTPSLPSYDDIANALFQVNSNDDASFVHGLLCGRICGASSDERDQEWKKLVLGDDEKEVDVLEELYEGSYHLLSEFSFEFNLLLPDDTENINRRTEALGLWCQGFLTGLKQFNVSLTNREDNEVTEALNDLTDIAEVSSGDIQSSEEDETAYFELTEYVRLCTLMIFQDLKQDLKTDESPRRRELND